MGGVRCPTAVFTVGGERRFLNYQGQPKYCRKCMFYGHLPNECEMMEKRRFCCQTGQKAKDCPVERTCDICKQPGHLDRQCKEYLRAKELYSGKRSGGRAEACRWGIVVVFQGQV